MKSTVLCNITIFGKPDDLITTTEGLVTYREWLDEERERVNAINRRLRRAEWPLDIITNNAGEIALAVLRIQK